MRNVPGGSIATRLIAALVAATTVLLGAGGAVYYGIERNRQLSELAARLNFNADQIASQLSRPVWAFEEKQVNLTLDGLMNEPMIYGVVVEYSATTHVRQRDENGAAKTVASAFPEHGLLKQVRTIRYQQTELGTAAVFADPAVTIAGLRWIVFLIVLFILGADAVLVAGISLVFWRMILQPLGILERYAGEVSAGGGTQVPAPAGRLSGELESLRSSIVRMVATLADNYQRIQEIAEELRDQKEFLDNIVENLPVMLFVKDAEDLRFVRFNRTGEEMLGFSRQELLGKTDQEVFSRSDARSYLEADAEVLKGSTLVDFPEEVTHRKNGKELILHTRKIPVLDSRGKARYLLGISEDITEKKHLESDRQQLKERLHRSEKMEALGTMAGRVAHDLNNVLGVLMGYSEMLGERVPAGSPLRDYVENILESTGRAATIVQDLLTLARRGVTVSKVTNLTALASHYFGSAEFARLQAAHPLVRFRTQLSPDLLDVKGSPVHLEKTIANLVANAAEALTESGEVTMSTENCYLEKPLRGYQNVQEGEYALVRVSDTGCGIPSADLGRIFEPFFTRKPMGKSGTGLGLSIVWGTVQDHGGYIDVQSDPGKGSTFTLYFPVTREQPGPEASRTPPERYRGRGETVLVVDDVPEQCRMAVGMLTGLGYNVRAASSGEEAVESLRRSPADILLLDMIMDPGMDGLETYRKVRELNPGQKAILVSGFSETDKVKQALALGAGAYVKKPYLQEAIGLAVRAELDR